METRVQPLRTTPLQPTVQPAMGDNKRSPDPKVARAFNMTVAQQPPPMPMAPQMPMATEKHFAPSLAINNDVAKCFSRPRQIAVLPQTGNPEEGTNEMRGACHINEADVSPQDERLSRIKPGSGKQQIEEQIGTPHRHPREVGEPMFVVLPSQRENDGTQNLKSNDEQIQELQQARHRAICAQLGLDPEIDTIKVRKHQKRQYLRKAKNKELGVEISSNVQQPPQIPDEQGKLGIRPRRNDE